MSLKFTGFSGLQTNPQHTLLINQDTWCLSFFFRLAAGSSTDSQILNQTFLLTCWPAYPQASSKSPFTVMLISLLKAYDPSLVGILCNVSAGGEGADAFTSGVDAFAGHHVLVYGVPRELIDADNPDEGYTQGLFMYVDGSPVDTLDTDVGISHNDLFPDGGASAIDPYIPLDNTKDPDFSIRLGNPNMIQLQPGFFGPSYYPGQVSYTLEDVAVWHDFTPQMADVTALRDRAKRPGDFPSGLRVWWKLDATSGNVSGADADLQNAASAGEHDLHIV
jgi:hypothetical protein